MAYTPASVITSTSGLSHLAAVYYDRVAVENLKPNLPYVAVTSRRKLPDRNGRTIQLYGYDLLAANTTPGAEGTVGTGINPTTSVRNTTVNQYFNPMEYSKFSLKNGNIPVSKHGQPEGSYVH